MSKKVKRRIEKKRKHIEKKWRHANMVFVYEKPIQSAWDICAIVSVVYTAKPKIRGAWGIHYRHAPRVIDYRLAWDWYT